MEYYKFNFFYDNETKDTFQSIINDIFLSYLKHNIEAEEYIKGE
jgi:hypothetical protein